MLTTKLVHGPTKPWVEAGWNALKGLFLKSGSKPVQLSFPAVQSVAQPAKNSRLLNILRNSFSKTVNSPSLSGKNVLLQNARGLAFQPTRGVFFPKFRSLASKFFQLGFVGIVCAHQPSGDTYFVARVLKQELDDLIGVFNEKRDQIEDDIIVVDEESDDGISIISDDSESDVDEFDAGGIGIFRGEITPSNIIYQQDEIFVDGGDYDTHELLLYPVANEILKTRGYLDKLAPLVHRTIARVKTLEAELHEAYTREKKLVGMLEEERMERKKLEKQIMILSKKLETDKNYTTGMMAMLTGMNESWMSKLNEDKAGRQNEDGDHDYGEEQRDLIRTYVHQPESDDWVVID